MSWVRPPAVAGLFYPAEADALRDELARLLASVATTGAAPKALIAPHAGLPYSGPVAASGYARLTGEARRIERVVLLGPAHRVPVEGLALSSATAFATPLGEVPVETEAMARLHSLAPVEVLDAAHTSEHSLEVHLPFLQYVLGDFTLVPLVVGEADAGVTAAAIDALWGGPETLVLVSSDLSHYLDYDTAREVDARTRAAIEGLQPQAIDHGQACGRNPINGLLQMAHQRGLRVETLDQRNSGDTAGPRDRVVGYGTYAFH